MGCTINYTIFVTLIVRLLQTRNVIIPITTTTTTSSEPVAARSHSIINRFKLGWCFTQQTSRLVRYEHRMDDWPANEEGKEREQPSSWCSLIIILIITTAAIAPTTIIHSLQPVNQRRPHREIAIYRGKVQGCLFLCCFPSSDFPFAYHRLLQHFCRP